MNKVNRVGNRIWESTPEEIAEIEAAMEKMREEIPEPEPTTEERIAELEEALALILSGVTE